MNASTRFLSIGVTLMFACALTVSRAAVLTPVIDAGIRDGVEALQDGGVGVLQALNVTGFEERALVEFRFGFATPPVTSAKLRLDVYTALGPFPLPLSLYAYSGDGSASLSDFDAGTFAGSLAYSNQSSVVFDVTGAVSNLVAAGSGYAGFILRVSERSTINLNGPFVAFYSMDYVAQYGGTLPRLFINDADTDGVADDVDRCPGTAPDAAVNADGCSIAQLCSCDGTRKGRHEYLRCLKRTIAQFENAGLITSAQARAIWREGFESGCNG
jgi:hypothetical protein